MEKLIGQTVLLRTPGAHYLGLLTEVGPQEVVLERCVWVADSHTRTGEMLRVGLTPAAEVETWPAEQGVYVARGLIETLSPWPHGIPDRDQ